MVMWTGHTWIIDWSLEAKVESTPPEIRVTLLRKFRALLPKRGQQILHKQGLWVALYIHCHGLRTYFLTETMQTGDAGQVAKQVPRADLERDDRKLGE